MLAPPSVLFHPINTLLLHGVLAEPERSARMTDGNRRVLSPLFWAHFNPYCRFVLDTVSRLDLAAPPGASPEGTGSSARALSTSRRATLF